MSKEAEPRQPMPMIEAALTYAHNGWLIFPLSPSSKSPLKGSQGYKDATRDAKKIQLWWQRYPTANIGLATGNLSGLIVLDIDLASRGA